LRIFYHWPHEGFRSAEQMAFFRVILEKPAQL
jgi:hypothetical protein